MTIEDHNDMIMGRICACFVLITGCRMTTHREASGHAEMHHQNLAGRELHRQEFCPTPEAHNLLPRHPFGEAFREGEAQVCPVLGQRYDRAALHDGGESAANCLDFR